MTDLLRDRIRAGAAWLDAREPGWRDRVVVTDLELSSPCRCVLGQVFTPHARALDEAGDERMIEAHEWNRGDEDVDGDYWDGYGYVVADPYKLLPRDMWDDVADLPGEYVFNGQTFISNSRAVELAFDFSPRDYGYAELTNAWRSYLKGHWA